MKSFILSAVAALALAGAVQAAPSGATLQPQASIPFVNHGGIRNWEAPDTRTLYVQDNHQRWYRADMFGPCLDLPYAVGIRFENRGLDRFDKFSTVRVGRDRCYISSVTASDGPPQKAKRNR
jgi:hypothetical protein